ncbi:MAG: glycosyltransferase [Deltaproteobacteria bacterium]|nr:glycosyltransferase [Deltaproteobacteria bacterium]
MSKQFASPIKLSVLMPVYNERYLVAAAIERALAFAHPLVREIEIVVVDDGSTDGTREILTAFARAHSQIALHLQPENQGKGAAIRRAIAEAQGELSVIYDADLEYYPEDWGHLLRPFFEAEADAVYGSRFLPSDYRRVLYHWHALGNRLLTAASNMMTDLNLTDMETCSKMVRTQLLKSIPIRSNDFAIEPELTAKLAKRGAVVYEVPIRYAGRTYEEGKKIGAKDGLKAFWAILKWKMIDDMYEADEYGSEILSSLSHVDKFNRWMADFLLPDVGSRVLEIGAGLGNLTSQLVPRDRYVATDINPHYLSYLKNLAIAKPYLSIEELNLVDTTAFDKLEGQFDTVICLNVLEHVEEDLKALRNIHRALAPGGKAIILVPQGEWLFSSLDEAVEHYRRYTKASLAKIMVEAGFEVQSLRDYNAVSVPGWYLNGKILQRRHLSRLQLKVFNTLTPVFRAIDPHLPWHGISVVGVGSRR